MFPLGDAWRDSGPFVCNRNMCSIRPNFPSVPLVAGGAAAVVIEPSSLFAVQQPFPLFEQQQTFCFDQQQQWRLVGYCVAIEEPLCVQPVLLDQAEQRHCQTPHSTSSQCRDKVSCCNRRRGNWSRRSSFCDESTECGCDCQRINEEVQIVVNGPQYCRARRYRLFARKANHCSSGWQYAVTEEGVQNAIVILLAPDPRMCASARDGYRCRRSLQHELCSGDTIFIPGERTLFIVHVYNDEWRY